MRLPILYALTYPEHIASEMLFPVMNLRHLEFLPPDMKKFPCLRLAYEAAEAGGAKTVALNAADEVAIAAFLEKSIGFDDIPHVIETVLIETKSGKLESIKKVLEEDSAARQRARERVAELAGSDALRPAPDSYGDRTYVYVGILNCCAFCGCDSGIHDPDSRLRPLSCRQAFGRARGSLLYRLWQATTGLSSW